MYCRCSGRIAGKDYHFAFFPEKKTYDLPATVSNFLCRPGTVRTKGIIGQIDKALLWQERLNMG